MSPELAPASKLITAVMPKGQARAVLLALKEEKGIVSAFASHARGSGHIAHRSLKASATGTEKDVLQVLVPADRQDELFEFIFDRGEIGRPHGGLIFQSDLSAASLFALPDLPDEV